MDEVEKLKQENEDLRAAIRRYEEDGTAKLYYSLNRKAWEMADLMNSINLKSLDIDDPKSKTFDRLKIIWQDAATISNAVKTLAEVAGINGEEEERKPKIKRVTTPESIADHVGELAGSK